MHRILFNLFFLATCFCSVISSSDDYLTQRIARDAVGRKTFGEKGNYVSFVVYIDLPSFSNFTDLNDVERHSDKFSVHHSNVKFYELSSAYALSYRIDLDAHAVQLSLNLGKAQIKGNYLGFGPSFVNSTVQEFEVNFHSPLMYSHYFLFTVQDGIVTLEKTDFRKLFYNNVTCNYRNAPSSIESELETDVSPLLVDAAVAKIYDEVNQTVNRSSVSSQIETEIAFRNRDELAARLKKAVTNIFPKFPVNAFNVIYYDVTNFYRIIHNFEVTVPSFTLHDVYGLRSDDYKTSFVGFDVHEKAKFVIQSPWAVFKVVYREVNVVGAQNKTFYAEYKLDWAAYELGVMARPRNSTVEIGSPDISVGTFEPSPAQGLYGDERDSIVQHLRSKLHSYFLENSYSSFSRYCKGFQIEGRITREVFK